MKSKVNIGIVNWSRNLKFRAKRVLYPKGVDEVVEAVRQCKSAGSSLRVVGKRGSQVPFVSEHDVILDLCQMNRVFDFDGDNCSVRLEGGATIKELIRFLKPLGHSLAVTPGVIWQTMAGALATDTHGIGLSKNLLHEDLLEVTLVDGNAEVRTIRRGDEDFNAVAVSLGMLGVVVEIKYRTNESVRFNTRVQTQPIESFLAEYPPQSFAQMYSWVIGSDYLIQQGFYAADNESKRLLTGVVAPSFNFLAGNFMACCFSRLPRRIQSLISGSSLASQFKLQDNQVVNSRAVASHLLCRLNDVEMACDIETFPELFSDLVELFESNPSPSWSIANIRFARASAAWLSLAAGRDTAYISFWFRSAVDNGMVEKVSQLMRRHKARPHWGKSHDFQGADLERIYSELEEFRQTAEKYDPDGLFENRYTKLLLH